MRYLVYLLLVANVGYFSWNWFKPRPSPPAVHPVPVPPDVHQLVLLSERPTAVAKRLPGDALDEQHASGGAVDPGRGQHVLPGRGDAQVIDARGAVALPGLVDLHTHLREPGREDAETIESGTQAAALGGFTAVHAMANTNPVADTAGVVEQVWRLGLASGYCEVRPVGAITAGLAGGHLAELGAIMQYSTAPYGCIESTREVRR